jgi:hypothetical protein
MTSSSAEIIPLKGASLRAARRKRPEVDPMRASKKEIVDVLSELMSHALKGQVIGLAFMAMQDGRGYIVDTAGECSKNPTWTRGALCALDDELARRIRE